MIPSVAASERGSSLNQWACSLGLWDSHMGVTNLIVSGSGMERPSKERDRRVHENDSDSRLHPE